MLLRLLGSAAIDAEGPDAADLLARPKPLALLVYLALARPRGFHRHDALLALFWPESDTERAQASLRQSLLVLRRALGPDALRRRGRAEVALDDDRVGCDVVAFE